MMESFNRKKHWENIYQSKNFEDVSWYQAIPKTSLDFIEKYNIPQTAKIIDIGGGNSFFVDFLLGKGYQNITVLDISESAIEKAKKRLGNKANNINWIVADISHTQLPEKYDFWHDRAVFHFLVKQEEIQNYLQTAQEFIEPKGILILGTFSKEGPTKCSGIEVKPYSEIEITGVFSSFFEKDNCFQIDHQTPSDKIQNFLFCSFHKR